MKSLNPQQKSQLQALLQTWKPLCDQVSIRWVCEETTQIQARNEKFDSSSTQIDQGVMIEIMSGGAIHSVASPNLKIESLEKSFQKGLFDLKKFQEFFYPKFDRSVRPSYQGVYQSPTQVEYTLAKQVDVMNYLLDATKALNTDPRIKMRSATARIVRCSTTLLNSEGADIFQNYSLVSSGLSATAQSDKDSQTRTLNGGYARCLQGGLEAILDSDVTSIAKKISEEALQLSLADNCPQLCTQVLLAPDQMTLQVHESIGHPLEYDRILGDERNYAGWSFVKPQDFGSLQYGSPLMNVTFDPTVSNEYASYAFDDVGAVATKESLIKDGKLMRGLGGLESQARLKLPGVSNSRSSSWNRAPMDRMANINLEAGTTPLADMISSIELGIMMHSNKSWSIDDYRNKFQFGCEYGQMIRNGKLAEVVKNPNYRGVTVPFWNSLKALSSETETYGTPYCGKGEPNQVIRVGHRTPYSLFENIEVFCG